MESPKSDDAIKQIIIAGVSSKSHEEEQGSTSMEQEQSGESADVLEAAAAADSDEVLALPAPPGFENYQLAIVDHDREYGCRYCDKKFSNKQALGGHQNAHKVERAMEKNEKETSIDFYGGTQDPNPNSNPFPARMNMPAPFLNSYTRPSDFLNRSLFSWNCGGAGVITYNPRPAAEHGFNSNVYHGWSAPPCHRVPQFAARPHYMLPAQNMNIRLPNFGPGSSRAFRPVIYHQGPPGFGRFVVSPGGSNWSAGPVNLRNVPGVSHDESGLDLSLKLG